MPDRPAWTLGSTSVTLALAVAGVLIVAPRLFGDGSAEEPRTPDPLNASGWSETTGAAPGYIEDRACAGCHVELAESYRDVAMSKAFYRPGSQPAIERFEPFFHEATGMHYEMSVRDGDYVYRSWQLDAAGQPINVHERRVDWILGSGNHSRTYLIQTPGGELFQLPLAWYTQPSSWGVGPGFDKPELRALQRLVQRECMFCHNAYPVVPAGSDLTWKPHAFPADLPEGLGCQRCHGPGAEHARAASDGDLEGGTGLVDLGALPTERRNDVCRQCHMQPAVAFLGVRRFGHGDYGFRPGQDLTDYVALFDVVEEGNDDRFEINHHPYRLEQSRCFVESRGELSCLTCHDPHAKVPAARRADHYRAKCLGCHEIESSPVHPEPARADCVACHMPERRTEDVVLVTMTDHKIAREPGGTELVRPRAERATPILIDAFPLYPERERNATETGIYRAVSALRAYGGPGSAASALQRLLAESGSTDIQPRLDLAAWQLAQRQLEELDRTLAEILRLAPRQPRALELLGIRRAAAGDLDEAIELLRRAAIGNPKRPEVHYNLGVFLEGSRRYGEARRALSQALELRPNLASAWFYLGRVERALRRPREAAAALRECLAIDPGHDRAYLGLAEVLTELGEPAEARRYLEHGARVARDAAAVQAALAAHVES